MDLSKRFALLDAIAIPIWFFDTYTSQMVWANPHGLEIWSASTIEELLARDFSQISPAIRARNLAIQEEIERGRVVDQQFTFYPRGVARTMRCQFSGIEVDGRVVMFVQAVSVVAAQDIDADLVRGIEALRHLPAVVSLVDASGALSMQNPAGLRLFGKEPIERWFADATIAPAMLREAHEGRVFRAEVEARTTEGQRWHVVEGRRTVDPVTGAQATLVLQLDVTERYEANAQMARQEEQILTLSAPILEVGEGVLAVPIHGTLDEDRGASIAERLLPAVVERRARRIVIDLTGLTAFEAASAAALMKIVQAVELLGASSMVTGIQPALAAALVRSGGDLSRLVTRRSLHDALRA
jgi:rsbT co-antagonist protein RsbR